MAMRRGLSPKLMTTHCSSKCSLGIYGRTMTAIEARSAAQRYWRQPRLSICLTSLKFSRDSTIRADKLAWQILGQFHADDNNPIYQSISGGSPPFAFHLTGPNGMGEGDYLAVQAFYALSGQTALSAATFPEIR